MGLSCSYSYKISRVIYSNKNGGIKSGGGELTKDPNFLVNNFIFMMFLNYFSLYVVCFYVIWELTELQIL